MNIWRKRPDLAPAGEMRSEVSSGAATRVPMRTSHPIEINGIFLGAAVEHELGVQFIAVDPRVLEMNQSIWPTIDYAKSSARQMFLSNQSFVSP